MEFSTFQTILEFDENKIFNSTYLNDIKINFKLTTKS